jgi:hypothetical protein
LARRPQGCPPQKPCAPRDYDGKLTLIGSEWHPPYDRPPLSKQVLSGEWEPERVLLRDKEAIGRLDAELRLGCPAVGLDAAGRGLLLNNGDRIVFDALVIATGVRPRHLPGDDVAGVHTVLTLDDALSLRAALLGRPKVVIVGAGFLGVEVAAVALGMNVDVPPDASMTVVHGDVADRRFVAAYGEKGTSVSRSSSSGVRNDTASRICIFSSTRRANRVVLRR